MNGLRNLLNARIKGLKEQRSLEPKSFPRKSPRSAYKF
jgi:hypothetical protein